MSKIVLVRNKFKKEIPLGLVVLKSFLDQTEHQTWLYDLSLERKNLEELEEIIRTNSIKFLGLSVGSVTYHEDRKLLEYFKKTSPNLKTIVGGVFASTPGAFTNCSDYIIQGRGEDKLLELLDRQEGICSPAPAHRINPSIINFGAYESPRDVNGNREFPLYTSMGCKFRCIYCSIPQNNNGDVWFKDPDLVVEEVATLTRSGITHIRFVDDMFGIDKEKTSILLKMLKKNAQLKGVYSQLRIDFANEAMLSEMRDSKFSGVYFGIESASEKTLRRIGKPYTKQDIVVALERARKLNLDATGAFTIGYPWETKKEIEDTLNFAEFLRKTYDLRPSVYIVTPFPNTPLSKTIDPNRIKLPDYSLWDAKHAVMDTENLRMEDIQELFDSFRNKNS